MKSSLGVTLALAALLTGGSSCMHTKDAKSEQARAGEEAEEEGEEGEEAEETGEEAGEEEVALDSVPAAVKQAALAAVPGIVFTEATKEQWKGQAVYVLEGKVGGVEYDVVVTPEGKVLEVEK